MSIRDDLCAQRAATEQIDRDLAAIEERLASRNTAHLVSRARSLITATQEFVTQALRQPLDERVDGRIVEEAQPCAGAYLRQCREAKGLSLFDLALRTETVPPVAMLARADWIGSIEDGTAPLSAASALRLSALVDADLEQLLALAEQDARPPRAGDLELRLIGVAR